MIRRAVCLLMTLGVVAFAPAPPAHAGCETKVVTTWVNGVLMERTVTVCDGTEIAPVDGGEESPSGPAYPTLYGSCVGNAIAIGVAPGAYCAGPDAGPAGPVLTPTVVASALARVDLPASTLFVQPPNGRTLVNLDTNFYTEAEPFVETVTAPRHRGRAAHHTVELHVAVR